MFADFWYKVTFSLSTKFSHQLNNPRKNEEIGIKGLAYSRVLCLQTEYVTEEISIAQKQFFRLFTTINTSPL